MADGQERGAWWMRDLRPMSPPTAARGTRRPAREPFRFSVRRIAPADPRHRLRIGLDGAGRSHRATLSAGPSRRSVRRAAGSCMTRNGTKARTRSRWKPRWPRWLVDCVGVDYFGNVVFINLHDRGTDRLLAHVGAAQAPEAIASPRIRGDRRRARAPGAIENLQLLSLDGTQVTDAGLVHLKRLSSLRWLKLTRTKVTDDGVRELQKSLPHLQAIR